MEKNTIKKELKNLDAKLELKSVNNDYAKKLVKLYSKDIELLAETSKSLHTTETEIIEILKNFDDDKTNPSLIDEILYTTYTIINSKNNIKGMSK